MTSVCKPLTRAVKYQDDPAWLSVLPLIDGSWVMMTQLLKTVDGNFPLVKVLAKKKAYLSAQEKTIRKGRPYAELGDLVKGLILTNDLDETVAVANFIINHFHVVKWEVKVGSKINPYRGVIHLDILLDELVVEVQVMPEATAQVKKKSNSFYKTNRAEEGAHLWHGVKNFSEAQLQLLGVN